MTEIDMSLALSKGKWRKRICVATASLFAALLVAELLLRTVWPVGGCVLALHDRYLFAPIPNSAKVQFLQPSLTSLGVTVRVNGHGMRGPEPDSERGRPRIMVFGDSFVMSDNEPYAKTFSAQLAGQWQDRVEVLCAGVTGYGPDQTLLRMEDMLPKYKPDGVVLVFCSYNDLGDPVRNHLMHVNDRGGLTRIQASAHVSEVQWFERRLSESDAWGLARLWNTHSVIRNWTPVTRETTATMVDYLRSHREDYQAHALRGETIAISLLRDVYDADVALQPEWPSSIYKVRLMEAILKEIRTLCETHSVPLAAVVVPGGPDMDPESWLKVERRLYPSYKRNNLCNAISGASQRAGIETLNLFSIFDERAEQEDLFVGPVDPHWNANGMRLGAEACAEFLGDQEALPFLSGTLSSD
ncbi:MAG: hypothetical protein GY930_12105 [bacterium]|nr:hypothetical protein [bacterium]